MIVSWIDTEWRQKTFGNSKGKKQKENNNENEKKRGREQNDYYYYYYYYACICCIVREMFCREELRLGQRLRERKSEVLGDEEECRA